MSDTFTQVPNDIIEQKMMRTNFSSSESRFMWALFRYTIGFHVESTGLSVVWLAKKMNMGRQQASKAKNKLLKRSIILNGDKNIRLNPDLNQWDAFPQPNSDTKSETVQTPNVAQTDAERSSNSCTLNKTINKNLNSEDKLKSETQEAFEYFCERHKNIAEFNYKADFAIDKKLLKELIKINGLNLVLRAIIQFLNSKDEWMMEHTGFTIKMFSSKFNLYANKAQQNKPQTGVIINKGVPR